MKLKNVNFLFLFPISTKFFSRRRKLTKEEIANSGRKTGLNVEKSIRCEDLVKQLKKLTREAGIRDSHASSGSFRKGNVSTGVLLGGTRIEEREKELEKIRKRGGSGCQGRRQRKRITSTRRITGDLWRWWHPGKRR